MTTPSPAPQIYVIADQLTPFIQQWLPFLELRHDSCALYHPDHIAQLSLSRAHRHIFIYIQSTVMTAFSSSLVQALDRAEVSDQSGFFILFPHFLDANQLPPSRFPTLYGHTSHALERLYSRFKSLLSVVPCPAITSSKSIPDTSSSTSRSESIDWLAPLQTTLHHEIRNALTPIVMTSLMLRSQPVFSSDHAQRALTEIYESATVIKQTLNRLNLIIETQLADQDDLPTEHHHHG